MSNTPHVLIQYRDALNIFLDARINLIWDIQDEVTGSCGFADDPDCIFIPVLELPAPPMQAAVSENDCLGDKCLLDLMNLRTAALVAGCDLGESPVRMGRILDRIVLGVRKIRRLSPRSTNAIKIKQTVLAFWGFLRPFWRSVAPIDDLVTYLEFADKTQEIAPARQSASVRARLIDLLSKNYDALNWSERNLGEALGCHASTVHKYRRIIDNMREAERLRRRGESRAE